MSSCRVWFLEYDNLGLQVTGTEEIEEGIEYHGTRGLEGGIEGRGGRIRVSKRGPRVKHEGRGRLYPQLVQVPALDASSSREMGRVEGGGDNQNINNGQTPPQRDR